MIDQPNMSPCHPDRHIACQEALEPAFKDLAACAEAAGWNVQEIAAALVDLADNHMLGLKANDTLNLAIALQLRIMRRQT